MKESRPTLLLVDDEAANLQKMRRTFQADYNVLEASGGEAALELLKRHRVAAIITDQRMPGIPGTELLRQALEIQPDAVRIILTGYTEVEDLMDAINTGHVHRYITKPWEPFALRQSVQQQLLQAELERENTRLSEELRLLNEKLEKENLSLKQEVRFLQKADARLVYKSQSMANLLAMLDRVVETDSTVLLQGETGTGKELLARYIQQRSPRSSQPFVPVNCGAVPSELVESAFFGHRKGSFTGASADAKGFFELADQGTLFLDEIGEAPLDLQVKLLRVLQDGRILAVGAQSPLNVDVRIVASTNRDLGRMVEQGTFRQDLFFRLNVFSVQVPPLRTRPEDVEVLAEFFLRQFEERTNKDVKGFEPATLELLQSYPWPGNVRELENEVERMLILADPGISIPPDLLSERIRLAEPKDTIAGGTLKTRLAALERRLILEALESHNQNKSHAAEALGITRQTIISKLKHYRSKR